MLKIMNVERMFLSQMIRKIIKDSIFKISILDDWATFFKLKKCQTIELELRDIGCFENLIEEMKKSHSFRGKRIGL